jgi:hypothetical protein
MEGTLKADGFDDAIIGVDFNYEPAKLVYSKQAMIEVLIEDGMSLDDAIEYLEYNVFCAYIGEGTPIYIDTGTPGEVLDLLEAYS